VTVDRRLTRIAVVVLGLLAFGSVVAWFGMVRQRGEQPQPAAPAASAPAQEIGTQTAQDKAARDSGQQSGQSAAPSFDVVRIEPSGEAVIAGRGAPGAAIEMLRDGKSYFRDTADAAGLFALVPPPLPPGSHEIVLQAIASDGTRMLSRQSVTVVIDPNRQARPLVTLTSPDRPTVVLSSPQPDAKVAAAPAPDASSETAGARAPPKAAGAAPGGARPPVKIVTVEAEDGGRLFVSGNAAPGATVRLYLNEAFIAPAGVGTDGALSFAIGRGVRAGEYRVRLDDVDPVSGDVRSRAEVNFNIPAVLAVAAGQPLAGGSAQTAAVPQTGVAAQAQPTGAATPEVGGKAAAPATASLAGAAPATPSAAVLIPELSTTVVGRGDNLWRISKRVYGQGTRYTVIYDANQAQIRNPRFIYPGQVFVVPPTPLPR
jgi:nucleoid-associated protein YgaU